MENVEIKKEVEVKEEKKVVKAKAKKAPAKPSKNEALANFMKHRNDIRKAAGLKPAYTEAQIEENK